MFTIVVQLLIESNNDPANGIILTKLQYVGFWTYFIAAPMLISGLIGEKLESRLFAIFLTAAIVLGFFTVSTNLIISSTPYMYGATFFARVGKLYPFVCTILFILCIYYYSKMLKFVSSIKNRELQFIIPVGLGLCILGGIIDYAGKLNGVPLLSWLKDPFSLGMLSISLSFGFFILLDYSQIVLEYQKSLKQVEQLLQKNYKTFNEFVQLIAKTLDAKDKYTAGHSVRVAQYAVKIARVLNLEENQIEILHQACLLHDIGKIGIPDGVLNKKSPLSERDRFHIYRHPVVGKEILSKVSDFQDILDVIYNHHERIDGTGYPKGLKKDEIPLLARILAVADAYDAMLSERPYRKAKTKLEAIKELLDARDKQFDAQIVEVFVDLLSTNSITSVNHLPE
ncbi:MAG: HD-GYP domain-containing protein [candidate division WOR-3 bacterium]